MEEQFLELRIASNLTELDERTNAISKVNSEIGDLFFQLEIRSNLTAHASNRTWILHSLTESDIGDEVLPLFDTLYDDKISAELHAETVRNITALLGNLVTTWRDCMAREIDYLKSI